MQELDIHDVEECELTHIQKLKIETGEFYTRDLFIYDIKGNKTVIALFADDKSILDIKI